MSPHLAGTAYELLKMVLDTIQFAQTEPVIGAKRQWPVGAIEDEDRLMPAPQDMGVRRSVVIRIDNDAKPAEPRDRRHPPASLR